MRSLGRGSCSSVTRCTEPQGNPDEPSAFFFLIQNCARGCPSWGLNQNRSAAHSVHARHTWLPTAAGWKGQAQREMHVSATEKQRHQAETKRLLKVLQKAGAQWLRPEVQAGLKHGAREPQTTKKYGKKKRGAFNCYRAASLGEKP